MKIKQIIQVLIVLFCVTLTAQKSDNKKHILIIVDVFLLLFSFFYTDQFHKVIRNSGFIISTILIRLSFSVDGLLNNCLIISSIAFGILILWIHNRFEKNINTI